jgi:hypothetical protein
VRRALLGALAAVMVIVGACLLAVSGWIYAAFGTDGIASTPLGTIASTSRSSAIVIDIDEARVRIPIVPVSGNTTLRLDSADGSSLIAGSSSMQTVDAFIGAREIDVAYRSLGDWALTHVTGTRFAAPWGSAPDWMTTGESLDVGITNGQTVAIANASGATGVNVDASLQFSAPGAPTAALILTISGGVVTLAGAVLAFSVIWLMRRRGDDVSA